MDEEIKNLYKYQEEMKSYVSTITNTMESFNNRLTEAEERISELEDKAAKCIQSELQLQKILKGRSRT